MGVRKAFMNRFLLEPFLFGKGDVVAKNKVFMGPMTLNTANPDGTLNDWIVSWYEQRAAGGVGAIIGAAAAVHQSGFGWKNAMTIHSDRHIEGWRRCVDAAHAHGVLFGSQLYHSGAASSQKLLGTDPVAPSAWTRDGFDPAREMTEDEIYMVIAAFASGARRSVDAGCDFIEIHGAHGYLVHQFTRRDVNRRTDLWGDLTAFPAAVVQAIRKEVGPDVPIMYRLSIHSDDPMSSDGPVSPEDLKHLIFVLEAAGVDVWDLSCHGDARRGFFGGAIMLPDWVRKTSAKPRIAAGNFFTFDNADEYCADGYAEGVALARALIADAHWVNNAYQNKVGRSYSAQTLADLHLGIDPGI